MERNHRVASVSALTRSVFLLAHGAEATSHGFDARDETKSLQVAALHQLLAMSRWRAVN